jgi:hypothetical protein
MLVTCFPEYFIYGQQVQMFTGPSVGYEDIDWGPLHIQFNDDNTNQNLGYRDRINYK